MWLEETGQEKVGKVAHREPWPEMMQEITVSHAAHRASKPGVSPLRGREGNRERGDEISAPFVFPFVCLLAFHISCHQTISPRYPDAEVF